MNIVDMDIWDNVVDEDNVYHEYEQLMDQIHLMLLKTMMNSYWLRMLVVLQMQFVVMYRFVHRSHQHEYRFLSN